ncbi:phospholipase A and acyltransferase 3-like [Hypanus sabinus]|uniref:phospholipase A and acyltransferase 3-like n=1 Tax=Hypanus sabinus TaxID=79690 RepID=UPI0028C46AD0|nr:phospholipase A and acyltransferase 3-like [Hypanus sabinus]XP_059811298.1 phospholipase A and acyltransferase 3-like [Hypanus sabinus]XP_059811299.1 phospholipase A and acyltransferase 3-like [Hypanus sabinus]
MAASFFSHQDDKDPKAGDLIEIFRPLYQHWALYVGNGYVIHLAPPSEVCNAGASSIMSVFSEKAHVKRELLHVVVGADRYRVNNKLDDTRCPRPINVILKEAQQQIGCEMDYSVLSANCEHFVMELRYGVSRSTQVEDAAFYSAAGVGILGTLAVFGYHFMKSQQKQKK